ncbi:MAG: hypothetical protein KJO09_15930 [Gammaproteobacteria bacterium]|nr:hypothetical protein [Gammaproteobacteria bacterium]
MKQNYFNNAEFKRYSLYALGEMALVIVGILIALQIDNWNTERVEQKTLESYLSTIARNIGQDLEAVKPIRAAREAAYEVSVRSINFSRRQDFYTASEMALSSQVLENALRPQTFDANTSGYEALKSSGNLDQMRGRDIETLLYDYYDTVTRLSHGEQRHNEYSQLLWLQVLSEWPDNVERWELASPQALTEQRLRSIQPAFRQLLQDIKTQELYISRTLVGPLLLDYERLDTLGRAFRRMIDRRIMTFDDTTLALLDSIHDPSVGYANMIVDGQVSWQSFYLLNSDANDPRVSYSASDSGGGSPFYPGSFQRIGDSLHIDYLGGVEWAGIWFGSGVSSMNYWSRDYSMFDKLVLEIKGAAGGEILNLNLEDKDDPLDGTSTKVSLQLTNEWQTFEIDLAEFETADLSILSVPLGFVFDEDAVSFAVRTAKYVKTD